MNLAIGTVHKYDVQPCIRQSSYRSQAPRNCMPYRWLYFRGSIGLGVSFGGIVSNSPIVHRGDRWPIPILAPSRVPAKSRGSHLNFVDRSTLRTQHTAHGNAAAHDPAKTSESRFHRRHLLSAHGASITLPAIRATPGQAYLVVFSLSLAFSQLRNDPRG